MFVCLGAFFLCVVYLVFIFVCVPLTYFFNPYKPTRYPISNPQNQPNQTKKTDGRPGPLHQGRARRAPPQDHRPRQGAVQAG
jgi:hypothetical protein